MITLDQIGLTLYTTREYQRTLPDLKDSLKRVADIGYQNVQISGIAKDLIEPEALVELCSENDLKIVATHEPALDIINEPELVAERLKRLGCRYTAYPYPAEVDLDDRSSIEKFAQDLERAGKVLSEQGKVLMYHNHAMEFRKFPGSKSTILEYLYVETTSANLQGEIDTYWVQLGGQSPAAWCKKLTGRLPVLHLKDYKIKGNKDPDYCEIGEGNLDIPGILQAASEAGTKYVIVEQDTCDGDPFDSIATSYAYLSDLLS